MQIESKAPTSPVNQSPLWQTVLFRKQGQEIMRRFNLRDSDAMKAFRNFMIWSNHERVTLVILPYHVAAEDAEMVIAKYSKVI